MAHDAGGPASSDVLAVPHLRLDLRRHRCGGAAARFGLGLAALGTPLAASLLYQVSPFDPVSFGSVSVFLLMVAVAASYVPARRAARLDPISALRDE